MIVVRPKPLEDIVRSLAPHKRVLVVGCNTCAAVALAGGELEVDTLTQTLRLAASRNRTDATFETAVLTRQCEPEFVDALDAEPFDAMLSLGCGAGVALLAERSDIPVLPALDTLFIGAAQGLGSWRAECSACGSCVLGETAGICPITRCAKGILNGPCGGVNEGRCELGDRDCAWVLIHEKLAALDREKDFEDTHAPKDHSVRTTTPEWDANVKEAKE